MLGVGLSVGGLYLYHQQYLCYEYTPLLLILAVAVSAGCALIASSVRLKSGDMWDALYASPWQSEIWQEAFPEYKTLTDDKSQSERASYIPNPACTVKGNLIFNKEGKIGDIYTSARRFSDISDNEIYSLGKTEDIFVDINSGNYNIKDVEGLRESIPGFKSIALDEIGRK